jgi:hypothetical protein
MKKMNETSNAEQTMSTTILNYPGFQSLPKGVRQMLLVSEAYFFNEPAPVHREQEAPPMRASRDPMELMGIPRLPAGFTRYAAPC